MKSLTFNHKEKAIIIYACSNNVSPKHYERYVVAFDNENDFLYEVEGYFYSMISGSLQFLPSCKSKSKRAYDKVLQYLYDTYKACPMDLWGTWETGYKFSELKQEKIRKELFAIFLDSLK
ncbi:hypothetical protein G7059_10320 [Erysipelothrix sp. HDW6A]|uniref:hypothetical protein n=1 Tax=Erysipelothrix sp. HDW6A TaxID=2714928 RepID=UPI00140B75B2|nr:hypothetical protein [Erysipelothrix sp. HDW6A]QIK58211.1 hypothetical protein G7059_10320 [Erysipelothrix sp. HDW6A]